MKENEIKILKSLNRYLSDKAILSENEYHRFDAENNNYIVELKYRNAKYNDWIIEFDKYAYNKVYAEINNKIFLYVVGYENYIWIYNITELDNSGYNYKWQNKAMPKQTEFNKNYDIVKYVGHLELSVAKNKIQMEV